VTVRVTDNGTPALSDSETIDIVVDESVIQDVRYFSTNYNWSLRNSDNSGIAFMDTDILKLEIFNGGQYRYKMHLDGSDVGLTTGDEDIDAFAFLPDGSIVVSTLGSFSVSSTYNSAGVGSGPVLSGVGKDLLRFVPITVGDTTTGTWSIYFRGSNVGLTKSGENIDGVSVLADGRLLISTTGSATVPGAKAADEDLLAFTPIALGANTYGTWALYFDGSDVGLTKGDEDVDGFYVREQPGSQPTLFLSTLGKFSVTGAGGGGEDVTAFRPSLLGGTTYGTFGPGLAWDASQYGISGISLDGIHLGVAAGQLNSAEPLSQSVMTPRASVDGANSSAPVGYSQLELIQPMNVAAIDSMVPRPEQQAIFQSRPMQGPILTVVRVDRRPQASTPSADEPLLALLDTDSKSEIALSADERDDLFATISKVPVGLGALAINVVDSVFQGW
jgi:hypothetical protein